MDQIQTQSMMNGVEITFSKDLTEVYVSILNPAKFINKEEIKNFLSDIGINTGIREDVINQMLDEKKVGQKYTVAVSQKPLDGKDGWFEFLFQTDVDTKPKILRDGSVDYSEYGSVPSVEEGDKIAIYHPATESRDGVNYHGETIVAKKGKELAKLKGKGFYVSENEREYFAKTSGRATYQGGRLLVENELVIEGDVSLSTGDVNFSNDIHIKGNVLTGTIIASAKGSILVDGYVEACQLYAGQEVVLKNGMQGNTKGKIVAGGSVSGKFFEQVTIQSGGDVCANAIMNSKITAKQDIIVSGRFGIIIGGEIRAQRQITATIIGNMSEVKTRIFAGIEEDLFAKLLKQEKEKEKITEQLDKVTKAISQIDILIQKSKREDLRMQKVKLIRSKVEIETKITENARQKQEVMEEMSRSNAAKVSVQKVIYPGTRLCINGVVATISEEANNIEITAKGSVIEIK